jgi:tetratricopeptide (TPR) repeat protein
MANVCAQHHYHYGRDPVWMERAEAASQKAVAMSPDLPEALVSQAWVLYARGQHDEAIQRVRKAIERKPDCEGAYYLLGRALFASGHYQDVANVTDAALEASGEDYNVYVPIMNALGALGKHELVRNVRQRRIIVLEKHLKQVPEDARARIHLACEYAATERPEDAGREADLAIALRPNDATVLYNAACVFCLLKQKLEAVGAIKKAWEAGFRDPDWARRDPDLTFLHGDADFERLYPEPTAKA